jgi:hypothetical protein
VNFLAAEGSHIVFLRKSGELVIADASDASSAKTVATGVTQFLLTADKTHVVYAATGKGTFVIPVR